MKPEPRRLTKGDAVEIKFNTHDHVLWHPAIVLFANADFIEVAYPSGHVKKLLRSSDDYRIPHVEKKRA